MGELGKIKVLIVDDSPLSRQMIAGIISTDPQMEIAALASNPREARDKIITANPDVITCDVEMPFMNGIEFVRWLLPQRFVPIVMVSSVSDKVFDAMRAGAVDFVVKPEHKADTIEAFRLDLIEKIKTASTVKDASHKKLKTTTPVIKPTVQGKNGRIIAIGASTGGTEAIFTILKSLPSSIYGVAVVQHIPPVFSRMFADRLNEQTPFQVKEAETGDYIDQGTVLVAPGDRHMKVKRIGSRFKAECFHGDKVNGHCPSVDVLFDSVAKESRNSVGIILTGMGHDGAKGLLNMRRKGSRTIGQDEMSSVVYGMPKAAKNIGAVEVQAALEDIPKVLLNMLENS